MLCSWVLTWLWLSTCIVQANSVLVLLLVNLEAFLPSVSCISDSANSSARYCLIQISQWKLLNIVNHWGSTHWNHREIPPRTNFSSYTYRGWRYQMLERRWRSHIAMGVQNGTDILKTIWQVFFCKLDIYLHDAAILFLLVCPRKMKTYEHIKSCAWIFIIYRLVHLAEVLTFHQTHPSLFIYSFSICIAHTEGLLCVRRCFKYGGWNREHWSSFCLFMPHSVGIPLHGRRSVSNKEHITKQN